VPTLFLNGRRIGGAVEYAELVRLVDDEARVARLTGGLVR
jgi:hypothetical protein